MKEEARSRKDRLAAALRENLKRRKARERALAAGKPASYRDIPKDVGACGPNAAKKDL